MTDKIKNIVVCTCFAAFLSVMAVVCVFKPETSESVSERRKLAAMPDLNAESVLSGKFMEDFETYAKDQFPFREGFRSIKAVVSTKVFGKHDNNGIYVIDGYASSLEYPLNEVSVVNAADTLSSIYDRYMSGKDMKVYVSVIPDKNFFLAESHGYPSLDYERLEEILVQQVDFAEYIDIMHLLKLEDYYKTDTHWRQEKITGVANKILMTMNEAAENTHTEEVLNNPFYGVYSGQSALNMEADRIIYLTNEVIDNMVVYDYENNKEISVYDMEKAYSDDPYEMFLSGPLSLITIENNMAAGDKELIVFRDSFGSAIAPLLAESYSKVTLVDIRYIRSDILDKFIDFKNQDVLFLYSTMVLNNSETFK